MNILKKGNYVTHTGLQALGTYSDIAPDGTWAIGASGGAYKKIGLHVFSWTKSVDYSGPGYSPIYGRTIDGDTVWFTSYDGSHFSYACADFTTETITHAFNTGMTFGSGFTEYFKFVSGGNLYVVLAETGHARLKEYSFSGTLLNNTILDGTYSFAGVTNFWFINGYVWCTNGTTKDVYRIDLSGAVTRTVTGIPLTGQINMFPNTAQTSLYVTNPQSPSFPVYASMWGTIDTTTAAWTLQQINIVGTPERVGASSGIGVPIFDLDTNNWLAKGYTGNSIGRVNKIYGTQNIYPGTLSHAVTAICLADSGNILAFASGDIYEFFWESDGDIALTPTTVWQQTSEQTIDVVESLNYGYTSIQNFYFSATAGDMICFTMDTAKDPNGEWNFSTGGNTIEMYISVHEAATEKRIAQSIGVPFFNAHSRSLYFVAPTTDNYFVRVQENPLVSGGTAGALYPGTYKLSYVKVVPSFTHIPDPQLPLSPVQFTDTSSGAPTEWSWDFGDGIGTSTLQNPTYTYSSLGTYNVKLTIKG